ncbi:hypothetical protein AOQ84DRAFT_373672 [Glonium stellatum]|uniref:Uncharacterized protein n=1 Tax=Glonium stellatum TaxID=574774 RepID=A0A8E2F758_9PEZI|nr:hypothetical protein AOQ84DRAFT_373672 [Glonium stellatum]
MVLEDGGEVVGTGGGVKEKRMREAVKVKALLVENTTKGGIKLETTEKLMADERRDSGAVDGSEDILGVERNEDENGERGDGLEQAIGPDTQRPLSGVSGTTSEDTYMSTPMEGSTGDPTGVSIGELPEEYAESIESIDDLSSIPTPAVPLFSRFATSAKGLGLSFFPSATAATSSTSSAASSPSPSTSILDFSTPSTGSDIPASPQLVHDGSTSQPSGRLAASIQEGYSFDSARKGN